MRTVLLLPLTQNPTHICWNTQCLPDGTYCLLVSGPHRVDTGCDRGWKLVGFSAELLKNCFQLGVMVHTLSPSHTSLQSEFWDSQSYYYTEKLCLKKKTKKSFYSVCWCVSVWVCHRQHQIPWKVEWQVTWVTRDPDSGPLENSTCSQPPGNFSSSQQSQLSRWSRVWRASLTELQSRANTRDGESYILDYFTPSFLCAFLRLSSDLIFIQEHNSLGPPAERPQLKSTLADNVPCVSFLWFKKDSYL